MTSTQTAIAAASAFAVEQPRRKEAPTTPLELVPAAPLKDGFGTKVKQRVAGWSDSPHGVAAGMWTRGVGAVAGYALPAAVMVPAARYLTQLHHGNADALFYATCIAAAASVGQVAVQGEGGLGNIALYKREGYRYPRLASFRDIMCYAVVPGLLGAYVAGQHLGAAWGVGVGTALSILVSSYGFTVMHVRATRAPRK